MTPLHHRLSRKRFLATATLLPAGLLLPGCRADAGGGSGSGEDRSAGGSAPGGAPTNGSHAPADTSGLPPRVVGLRSLGGAFRFDPEGVLVEPGTELHWLNMGDFHTTTAFHPDYADLLPAGVPQRIPEGAEPWHSGMLGLTAGTQFSHRFTVEGVYDYFCQPHYSFGMVGRVVVGGPRGGPAVTEPLPDSPPEVRENMPSVEAITGPSGVTYEWAARINGVLYRTANGDEAAPWAEAVAAAMASHAPLRSFAGPESGRLDEAVAAFRDAATSGEGYEEILRRADGAKSVLRALHDRG